MDKSIIPQDDKHVSLHINKDDLAYMIQELEKLHEEGGQFSLRLHRDEDNFVMFQKVQIDENNNTQIIYEATVTSIWSSVIFFTLCLFCFIAALYGVLHFLS